MLTPAEHRVEGHSLLESGGFSSRVRFTNRDRPPGIGTAFPPGDIPILRLKRRSAACGVPARNVPAFSRKNGRFSGKKSGKRVRLVRCSSTSEKVWTIRKDNGVAE